MIESKTLNPTQTKRRATNNLAFTLVEVAIATGVVALALVSLLGMAAMGLRMGRVAVDDTFTSTIAQDIFVGLRAEPFSSLADGEAIFDRDGASASAPGYSGPHYKCVIDVTRHSDHLATVQLALVWPNVNNFTQSPNTNLFFTRIANLTPY